METHTLLFWRPSPAATLSAKEIGRDLLWGEEVEGLIDLPVREILDRLKAEYPRHEEKPGALICQAGDASFEVTWSWQHLRVQHSALPPDERERLIDAVESFECMAFDGQTP